MKAVKEKRDLAQTRALDLATTRYFELGQQLFASNSGWIARVVSSHHSYNPWSDEETLMNLALDWTLDHLTWNYRPTEAKPTTIITVGLSRFLSQKARRVDNRRGSPGRAHTLITPPKAPAEDNPLQSADGRELRGAMVAWVQQYLDPESAKILMLRLGLTGGGPLSNREVAEILDPPLTRLQVKGAYDRAIRKLRRDGVLALSRLVDGQPPSR